MVRFQALPLPQCIITITITTTSHQRITCPRGDHLRVQLEMVSEKYLCTNDCRSTSICIISIATTCISTLKPNFQFRKRKKNEKEKNRKKREQPYYHFVVTLVFCLHLVEENCRMYYAHNAFPRGAYTQSICAPNTTLTSLIGYQYVSMNSCALLISSIWRLLAFLLA